MIVFQYNVFKFLCVYIILFCTIFWNSPYIACIITRLCTFNFHVIFATSIYYSLLQLKTPLVEWILSNKHKLNYSFCSPKIEYFPDKNGNLYELYGDEEIPGVKELVKPEPINEECLKLAEIECHVCGVSIQSFTVQCELKKNPLTTGG